MIIYYPSLPLSAALSFLFLISVIIILYHIFRFYLNAFSRYLICLIDLLKVDLLCGHLIFDLFRQVQKHLLYIKACVGTGLKERHSELFSQLPALFSLDQFLVDQISLVSNEHTLHIRPSIRVSLELANPVSHIVEAVLARAVICQDYALRILVVVLGDVPVPFLASCVPDLQLDGLAVQLDVLDLEIYPDGRNEGRVEVLVREFQKDAGLAHT